MGAEGLPARTPRDHVGQLTCTAQVRCNPIGA